MDRLAETEQGVDPAGTIAVLEELLELKRLEKRVGTLSRALSARRDGLERDAADAALHRPIPARDLAASLRASTRSDALIPEVFGGIGGRLGRASEPVLWGMQGAAALGVSAAGALGPLLGLGVEAHFGFLAAGPLPVMGVLWGFLYPVSWLGLSRWPGARCLLPWLEPLLVLAGVAALLILHGPAPLPAATWLASAVFMLSVSAAATSVVRPLALRDFLRRAAAGASREGRAALAAGEPETARGWLERALILAPEGWVGRRALQAARVAVLFEAEALFEAGKGLRAWALLASRGIRPSGREQEAALRAWAEDVGRPPAEMIEAAGLHERAARLYREAGLNEAAERCYRRMGERATDTVTRSRAARGLAELGGRLHPQLIEGLLDDIGVRGGAATDALSALAGLSRIELQSDRVTKGLARRLTEQPPERAVAVLEAVVGTARPIELPGLFRLLADAYRRLGHRGTARRIEAEIGTLSRPAPSEPTPSLGEAAGLTTGDLARALADRYDLVCRLGEGAMGAVYLAEDLVLGRRVALKVLRPKMASELFVHKFREEARVVAGLDHPGIVRVYDAGQAGPWTYFVMELVTGPDFAAATSGADGPSLRNRVRWIAEVADAMAYAHDRGVIHRDLKPENVLISEEGRARVTDFGVAHVKGPAPEATAFARAGLQVGTPSYMAPEQLAHGAPAGPATDIYALGMTLYYGLVGWLPFNGDILAKLDAPPPSVRAENPLVSESLDRLVSALLAVDPGARPSGMAEVAARLRATSELSEGTPEPHITQM